VNYNGDYTDLGRQYAGFVLGKEKIIYVNAFPLKLLDYDGSNLATWSATWRVAPVIFCDGGHRFFGVEYDPKKKTFSHFEFNGIA
jgi:hypothetical protein